ncbi:MAG: hypothetical protein ACO3E9_14360, partial [Gemmataceae bacterium]
SGFGPGGEGFVRFALIENRVDENGIFLLLQKPYLFVELGFSCDGSQRIQGAGFHFGQAWPVDHTG